MIFMDIHKIIPVIIVVVLIQLFHDNIININKLLYYDK